MVASAMICANGHCVQLTAYAVSVGAVCGVVLIVTRADARGGDARIPQAASLAVPYLACFLAAWWLVATYLLTFIGPFASLGNGYFAAWAALFSSLRIALMHSAALDDFARKIISLAAADTMGHFVLLATSSSIVWVQAAASPQQAWSTTWTIVVGLVSMLMCLVVVLMGEALGRHRLAVSLFLAGWWVQGLFITFIPSWFISSVNGFVSVWASIALSLLNCSGALKRANGAVISDVTSQNTSGLSWRYGDSMSMAGESISVARDSAVPSFGARNLGNGTPIACYGAPSVGVGVSAFEGFGGAFVENSS